MVDTYGRFHDGARRGLAHHDSILRDSIAEGHAGRSQEFLTSCRPLFGRGDQTERQRRFVVCAQTKEAGADLIKIFASGDKPSGERFRRNVERRLREAKTRDLRTLVRLQRRCSGALSPVTQIEHGLGATDDDLKLLAQRGTYFDPQGGLLLENYLLNRSRYAGTPFYPPTEEGFEVFKTFLPMSHELIQRALKIPGLKIVFGTDAVAGAHGRNAEEFIDRVRDCGVDPMAAMISANSLGAEAMGLAGEIGSIAPGIQADIIALDGDPQDITAVRRVVFVMKSRWFKNVRAFAAKAYPQITQITQIHDQNQARVSE